MPYFMQDSILSNVEFSPHLLDRKKVTSFNF